MVVFPCAVQYILDGYLLFTFFFYHTVQLVGSQLPAQGPAWVPCVSRTEPRLLDYRGDPGDSLDSQQSVPLNPTLVSRLFPLIATNLFLISVNLFLFCDVHSFALFLGPT